MSATESDRQNNSISSTISVYQSVFKYVCAIGVGSFLKGGGLGDVS